VKSRLHWSEVLPLALDGQGTALKGGGVFHCSLWEQSTTEAGTLRKLLLAGLAL